MTKKKQDKDKRNTNVFVTMDGEDDRQRMVSQSTKSQHRLSTSAVDKAGHGPRLSRPSVVRITDTPVLKRSQRTNGRRR